MLTERAFRVVTQSVPKFVQHYGSIVFFDWFSDGMIMIAFSEGYFIVISTKIDVSI